MAETCHSNGSPACVIYGPPPGACSKEVGAIVAFNLLSHDGAVLNHGRVGQVASACGLDLRWGAFCNRGGLKHALETAHGTTCPEMADPCWQPSDATRSKQGNLNGALRASFGFASRFADAQALVRFVTQFALDGKFDVKGMRRDFWFSNVKSEDAEQKSLESKSAGRKRCRLFVGRCNKNPYEKGRQKFCKRASDLCQVPAAAVDTLVCKPGPHFSTPGEKDALPACCGTFEERMEAGLAYPDACCAVRAVSIPGLCWYLHDQRHKHSAEEEFFHGVYGAEPQGRTVLMIAAGMGLLSMVDVMIDVLGVDVNHASSTDGDTALHRAACKGHPAVCTRLLAAGADVAARVTDGSLVGWTATQVAEWKASGDRWAHPTAHHANYNPRFGGAFAEAAAVLKAASETKT